MKPLTLLLSLALPAALAACAAGGAPSVPAHGAASASAYSPPLNAGPAYVPGGYDSSARNSLAQGDVAAAAAGFGQAVEVNPFDPIALNNLAVAKTEAGDFHTALDLLQRAERLAPQNTEIAANLARLRSWNQNYAMQEGGTLGEAGAPKGTSAANLPPEPPQLWDTRPTAQK